MEQWEIFFSNKFGGEAVNKVVIITTHQVDSCQADHQKETKDGEGFLKIFFFLKGLMFLIEQKHF